jgi:UDP-N-acetylmuramoyl-tripeptide--D-alanyl-D-alanine ligase
LDKSVFARIDYDIFTVASVCSDNRPALQLPDTRLSSITNSSLEVKPGALFVPLVDRRDGHEFIADALRRGAEAFFLKKNHPVKKKLGVEAMRRAIEVDDPLLALGRLAHFHRKRFTPFVVAVTGSNGKTTTKEMLAQIFRRALGKKSIATEKNYNNHIGLPFTMFAIRADTRVAVLEMGMNHAGEIAFLSQLAEPHAAVISSIGHAHIEFFRSRAGIAAAKAEVLEGMPSGGCLYVPATIAEQKTITGIARHRKIRIKKISPAATAKTDEVLRIKSATPRGFQLKIGNETVIFPYANAAWVSNLALAAAVAADAGVDVAAIVETAKHFKPASGRMQLKRLRTATVIDDGYNANPDSAVASIDAALQVADGKPVVCVFGDFKELGKFSRALHAWTGAEAARKGVAAFYGVGNDMRQAVRAFEKKSLKNARSYAFPREKTAELVAQLQREPRGSVILVKGSRAMKMEEIVELLSRG